MAQQQRKFKVGEQVETTVRSWEFGKTPNKGTKYVRIRFNNYITKTIWPWSPKAQAHAMETLETLGFRGKDLTMLRHEGALNTQKQFLVTIDEINTKDNKHYYEASWVNDPDKIMSGFNAGEMTKDELDEFSLDTSAYIENAQDIEPPAASDDIYNTPAEEPNFAADSIPF